MSATRARLEALGAAALFSTGGAAVKTAAFTAPQIACFRSAVAAIALVIWARGRIRWSPQALLVGVVYAATLDLYVAATKLTTAANAIFLQSTSPLYLLLLGPLVLHERVRRSDLAYLVALAAGLGLCFSGTIAPVATAPNPRLGNLFGLLSGVSWALTIFAFRYVERDAPAPGIAMASVITGNVMASLVMLPFAWPLPYASMGAWLVIGYLGVFQIGLAYILVTKAVRELPAFELSLLLLLEPVLNPIWTWIVWKEYPGTMTLAGGAIIVVATALKASVAPSRQLPTTNYQQPTTR
jgi:drug/metabolite transporter (DMT)-like permease